MPKLWDTMEAADFYLTVDSFMKECVTDRNTHDINFFKHNIHKSKLAMFKLRYTSFSGPNLICQLQGITKFP